MATLRIPKEHQGGFKKLVGLVENDSVQELLSALREIPPILYGSGLPSKVASRVDTIPRSDIDDVMEVLLPLYLLRARYESSAPDFAEDVCRAMDRSGNEELQLLDKERERFKDCLIELLSVDSINLGVKAQEVLFENEHSFLSARIVTDTRPIFGSDPEDLPEGMVVVHMLKITYRAGDQRKDFFVALDTADVSALSGVLSRAETKAESLKSLLDATETLYIGPE